MSLCEVPLNYLHDVNAIEEVLVTSSSPLLELLMQIGTWVNLQAYTERTKFKKARRGLSESKL